MIQVEAYFTVPSTRLYPWGGSPGRYDGRIIILRHVLITAVQNGLIPGVFDHTGFEVIRQQKSCDPAEIAVGIGMAGKPLDRSHMAHASA